MSRERSFTWFLLGSVISFFGSAMGAVAVQVLAVQSLGASTVEMGWIALAPIVATVLCSLSLAAWIEHRPKRPLLRLTLVVRCLVWAALPLLAWMHFLTVSALLAVTAVAAVATLCYSLGSMAHLKDLVGQEQYAHAQGRVQSGQWLALTVGPVVGGVLSLWWGPLWVIALDALTFLIAYAAMTLIRLPEAPPPPRAPSARHLGEVSEGLRLIGTQPQLRLMLASWALFAAGTAALSPLTTVLYLRECEFTSQMYGVVMAVGSLAGCVASWMTGRITRRYGDLPVHVWSSLARTPWQFLAAAVPAGPAGVPVASVSFAGVLTFSSVGNVAGGAVRAALTPDHAMARVSAVWQFVPAVLSPLLITGATALAGAVGTRITMVTLSALMLIPLLRGGATSAPQAHDST